jgi:pyruvate/2-oxoglutarate dehydrogenase complex dihydrolipoamide acyltransferase (E2) component
VGKLRKILHIDDYDRMDIRSVFTITGSFDHRFVNGKSGAEFMGLFKNIIEEDFI